MQSMEYELLRLASFSTFPNNFVSTVRLAQAGFFYNGKSDEVTCFCCGLKHKKWRENDIPLDVHKILSPNCSFLTKQHSNESCSKMHKHNATDRHQELGVAIPGINTVNQIERLEYSFKTKRFGTSLFSNGPIMSPNEVLNNQQRIVVALTDGHNIGGKNPTFSNITVSAGSVSVQSGLHADDSLAFSSNSIQSSIQKSNTNAQVQHDNNSEKKTKRIANSKSSKMIERLGISFDKPVYQQFAVATVRLESFKKWPKHLTQTPQDLSRAGFFYEGTRDKVYCFFCGGGLSNWDPENDPWEEHARWFPKCVFLRQCKGDEFVVKMQMEKERSELMIKQGENGENKPNQNVLNQQQPVSFSHPAVVNVLEMGYRPSIIRQALEAFVKSEDKTNLTAELLLMKIWIKENEKTVQTDAAQGNKAIPKPSYAVTDNGDQRRAILEENRQLKELQTCKICLDEEVSIVFLPCGHMSACSSCAPALRKCPICRTFIKGTVKAIIS